MNIKKLPQYLINKLKAGEIVERPASIVKELIENSIDAGAQNIVLSVVKGGNDLVIVEDDGVGINREDLDLSISRYATSKLIKEEDLMNISTYGFRGEALASISQVSDFKIQTKSKDEQIGYELRKIENQVDINTIPFNKESGTIVYVKDIFFNVPARKKFLKSAQTEYNYIKKIFLDFALINYKLGFKLIKDDKVVFDFVGVEDLYERINNIFNPDWETNYKLLEKSDSQMSLYGVISDASLTFSSPDNIKIFVNKRPVQDRIIKKSIIDSYYRQIAKDEYPLAILFLDIVPERVDVNVHPRKTEVKFLDPGSIYNFVNQSILKTLGESRISNIQKDYLQKISQQPTKFNNNIDRQSGLDLDYSDNVSYQNNNEQEFSISSDSKDFKIIGQLWDCYIILQEKENMYLVDQHAIAERIMFENLRKDIKEKGLEPEVLLSPIIINISKDIDVDERIRQLIDLGFDISEFSDQKLIIYSMPKVFLTYKIDISKLMNKLLYIDNISLDIVLDNILATKACRASIKAGEKLSYDEMSRLVKDGLDIIKGLFVCQHGRPSFIKIPKDDIIKIFDR